MLGTQNKEAIRFFRMASSEVWTFSGSSGEDHPLITGFTLELGGGAGPLVPLLAQ
jgi:hypothetical protein